MSRRRRKIDWSNLGLGFLAGWLFRGSWKGVLAKLATACLVPFVLWGYLVAEWHALPPAGRWGLQFLGVALVVLWAMHKVGRLPWEPRGGWSHPGQWFGTSRVAPAQGFLPRTMGDPFWVYIISEWRDAQEYLMDRETGRKHGDSHLVYVGKANDFDNRAAQHQGDKPWWHDELEFRLVRCFTEQEALNVERGIIERAAQARLPRERPRENKAMNASYDPARCQLMLAKASRKAVRA